MRTRPQVALLIETSNAYARGLLRGVHRYQREHRSWSIFLNEQGRGDAPPTWLSKWQGDGIIARIENEPIAKAVAAAGLPTVDLSAASLMPNLSVVETDNEAIARLAFDHLVEHGFKHLAFCGDEQFGWSRLRRDWFARFAAEAGIPAAIYPRPNAPRSVSFDREQAELAEWVRGLPKPVGVMACYDTRGWQLLEVCRSAGIAVPDEVAVIGVDNDELLCELTQPSLSSVIPDPDRTGYEAAALLDRIMAGEPIEPAEHLIKPLGVVTRQSTDVLAIADADISRAVRFIRDHACEGIKVDAVVKELAISRRVLEHRFKSLLGRTPHEEIVRVQMQRVTQLLTETELPLAIIAARAGFKHVEYMTVAFKRAVGLSPRDYRAERRANC